MWQTLEVITPADTATKTTHRVHLKNVLDAINTLIQPKLTKGGYTSTGVVGANTYMYSYSRVPNSQYGITLFSTREENTTSTSTLSFGVHTNSIAYPYNILSTSTYTTDYNDTYKQYITRYYYINTPTVFVFSTNLGTTSCGITICTGDNGTVFIRYDSTNSSYGAYYGVETYEKTESPAWKGGITFTNYATGSVTLLNNFTYGKVMADIYRAETNGVTLQNNAINYIGGMPFYCFANFAIRLQTAQATGLTPLITNSVEAYAISPRQRTASFQTTAKVTTYPYIIANNTSLEESVSDELQQ